METVVGRTSRTGRQRIGRRLITQVIAFSSAIALLTTGAQLLAEYGRQKEELVNSLDSVNLYLPSMVASVWNVDVPLIETTLAALGHLPAVERVAVKGRGTGFLSGLEWSYGSRQARSALKRSYVLQHVENGLSTPIADLEIDASVDVIYQHIAKQALTILAANTVKTFFVAIFMLMLVRRLITGRIEDLATRLGGVARGIVDTEDVADGGPAAHRQWVEGGAHGSASAPDGDEIEALCRDFDVLVGRLNDYSERMETRVAERTARLATLNAELAQSNQALALSAETLHHLGEVGREITASLDADTVFEALHRHLAALLDARLFSIFLVDSADGALVCRFRDGEGGAALPARIARDDPGQEVARVARDRRERVVEPDLLQPLSALYTPLVAGERLIGVMVVQSPRRHAYGERERMIFRTIAAYGAIALDNTAAYGALADSKAQVTDLLDNSGEGFLSFGADLVIDKECSRACAAMLGTDPAGREAPSVLFPGDPARAELLRRVVGDVLAEPDQRRRALMFGLLPGELSRRSRLLAAKYRMLQNGHVMVILADVTEEKALAKRVAADRMRLEMVVAAVTESRDFFDAVNAVFDFAAKGLPALLEQPLAPAELLAKACRQIHTLKGLLHQFSFPQIPGELHLLEGRLQALRALGDGLTLAALAKELTSFPYAVLLAEDLTVISEVLGKDFVEAGERIHLSAAQADAFADLSRTLLVSGAVDLGESRTRTLLEGIGRLRKVALSDLLGGFNRMVRQAAEQQGKRVRPIVVEGGDTLWIEPRQCRPFLQVLGHVFRNAVAHGIESPDIRAAAGKSEAGRILCSAALEGSDLHLEIADDGAGLDIALLRQRAEVAGLVAAGTGIADLIFADTLSTQGEADQLSGRGIGLAALRETVLAMGGEVTASSESGRGTRFRFRLPLEVEVYQPPVAAPAAEVASGGGAILVVEDNPVNRKVLMQLLAKLGYGADAVEDGRQGIDAWRGGRYTTVLTDCHMPGMDGFALAAAIRAEEAAESTRPRTTILAVTSGTDAEELLKCRAAGMDAVIAKPITADRLRQSLTEWLGGGRTAPDA